MSRTDHKYTEISHFRAPYENWISLGAAPSGGPMLTQAAAGYGIIPGGRNVPGIGYGYGAAAAALPPEQAAMLVVQPDGSMALKPEVVALLLPQLAAHVIVVFNDDSVKLAIPMPQGEVREFADKWLQRKLGEGKTVVAGSTTGVVGLAMPTGTVDKLLMAFAKPSDVVGATAQGQFGVLAKSGAKKAGLLGPVGVAVAVLAGAGLVYYFAFGKKKHRKAAA